MRAAAIRSLVLLLGFSAGLSSAAPSPVEAVNAALARIDIAHALVAEAQKKSGRIEALSEAVAAYEEGLAALRVGLRANSLEIGVLRTRLLAEEEEIGGILELLQTMSSLSGGGFRHPDGPLATVRSGMSLAATLPDMRARTGELRARLEELAVLNRLQDQAILALRDGMNAAAAARMMVLNARDGEADGVLEDDTAMILQQSGGTLAEVARVLAASPMREEAEKPEPGMRLPSPVSGRVLRAFNAPDAAGIPRSGVVISAHRGAPVTAPTAASVRFAGAFADYGQVVILEIRPGDLLVLAGLAVALVSEGENVAAGEIVALLGGNSIANEDNLIAIPKGSGSNRQETLYIETRENGEPVDPTTWLDLPAQ